MKDFLFFAAFTLSISVASAQQTRPDCSCPEGKIAATFDVSHQTTFVVCGFKDTTSLKGKILFSEFSVAVCGAKHPFNHWGADQFCQIQVKGDTLLVKELISLPTGQGSMVQFYPWRIDHVYIARDKIIQHNLLNRNLPKLTPAQIAATLLLYQQMPDINNEQTNQLADRLFMAAISGSSKARKDLLHFKEKFTALDGAYGEDYRHILDYLKVWEQYKHG